MFLGWLGTPGDQGKRRNAPDLLLLPLFPAGPLTLFPDQLGRTAVAGGAVGEWEGKGGGGGGEGWRDSCLLLGLLLKSLASAPTL